MKYLVDTHVVIWWMHDDRKLSTRFARALEKCERTNMSVGLSALSLWEIAKLVERRRLELTRSLDETLRDLDSSSLFEVLPLTARIAAESTRLGGNFPGDPIDQLIAATARCHGLTLMTADQRILASGAVAVL